MMQRLTGAERQLALIISVLTLLGGLAMAAAGRADPLGIHGWIVVLFAGAVFLITLG